MKTTYKLLGVALASVILLSGVAVAAGGAGHAGTASSASITSDASTADDPAHWGGPSDANATDRPLDRTSETCVVDDDRVDRFQERFDLTDEEVETIQETAASMIDDGADREAVRAAVTEMLEEYGVEEPELGPVAGAGHANGAFGPAMQCQFNATDERSHHWNETTERRGGWSDAGDRSDTRDRGDARERGEPRDRWSDDDSIGPRGQSGGAGPHGPASGSCMR